MQVAAGKICRMSEIQAINYNGCYDLSIIVRTYILLPPAEELVPGAARFFSASAALLAFEAVLLTSAAFLFPVLLPPSLLVYIATAARKSKVKCTQGQYDEGDKGIRENARRAISSEQRHVQPPPPPHLWLSWPPRKYCPCHFLATIPPLLALCYIGPTSCT